MRALLHYVLLAVLEFVWSQNYPTAYKYLLADLDRCKTESPDVLLWVQGRATSPDLRSMIRETVGSSRMWPDNLKVMTVFFMGALPRKYEAAGYQTVINFEYEKYRDIVQTDFREDYKNQTSKMISAINYISDYCRDVALILRMDDDVLFHPQLILQNLTSIMKSGSNHRIFKYPNNTIACRLISDFGVWHYKDHPGHFNAVDDSVLPGEEMYPPFCAGFFIAMSGDVPRKLQPHIKLNRPFWMDDRYMGVLQRQALTTNIDITNLLDFGYHDINPSNLEDLTQQRLLAKHLPGHLKYHLSQLFQFLNLSTKGLKGHFETIEYNKNKKGG